MVNIKNKQSFYFITYRVPGKTSLKKNSEEEQYQFQCLGPMQTSEQASRP